MPIANCKRCGRIYNRLGREICAECVQQEDELIKEIRQFLRQHKHANIYEVAEQTKVDYAVIVEFIRDGRVILRDNPNMGYPCERCGKKTMSGRFCADCSAELVEGLGQAAQKLRDKNNLKNKPNQGFYSR